MKLEEAIERAENIQMEFLPLPLHRDWEALQLLIEAGRRLVFNRLNTIASSDELLPGETVE